MCTPATGRTRSNVETLMVPDALPHSGRRASRARDHSSL